MSKKSFIYIIGNGKDLKLGVSVKPEKRIKQLQTGSSQSLELVEKYCLPAELVYNLEKQCHEELNHYYKKRGEWFSNADPWHVKVIIEEICEKHLN